MIEKLAMLGGLLGAILFFILGRGSKKKDEGPVVKPTDLKASEDINEETIEEINAAGDELADNLSADRASKRSRIAKWYRDRAGRDK